MKKYFIVPVIALLAAGCQDDLQEGGTSTRLATGEEVTFGATLGESTASRTVYGSYDDENNEYPIYWEDGDEVIVTSPECGAESANGGNGSAVYSVSVDSDKQNYASSLTKTGETGVRWGNNTTGTFYSVYPASGAEFANNDYTTVTLNMPQQQDCKIVVETDDTNTVYPNMDACFMYAKTENVTNGSTVNLKYIPISTAIRFTLQGPSSGNDVTVQNIRFIAPENKYICGTFTTNLSEADGSDVPTMEVNNGYNVVSIKATYDNNGGLLTLGEKEKATMTVFLLLEEETIVNSDWSIEILAYNGTSFATFTKKLSLKNDSTLVPGKVHELPNLPYLDFESESTEWDTSNWMANLPRNVYLSEISIPGSWNSKNSQFQASITAEGNTITGTSIDDQYNAGARAFHIDTRWQGSVSFSIFRGYTYRVDSLGVADNGDTDEATFDPQGKLMSSSSNPTFASVLDDITNHVKPNEYMVVYCTFAQDSYDYQTSNGGWEYAISTACANNTAVIDARDLNENSVVADVLGKVIVIINTDENVTELGLSGSKCLFMTDMGMELDQSTYQAENYTVTTLAYGSGSDCVNALGTHAQVTANGNSGYTISGRGYAPTLSERKEKASNILAWSKENHQNTNYTHDTWFYLGLGGYISNRSGSAYDSNAYSTVASTLNGWIEEQIAAMKTSRYCPVGIVLMNNVLEYGQTMVSILELNNIYSMAYDENRSSDTGEYLDGSGTTTTSVKSAATGYSSGMKDYNTNVIRWD